MEVVQVLVEWLIAFGSVVALVAVVLAILIAMGRERREEKPSDLPRRRDRGEGSEPSSREGRAA